jgi:hypothetical protein
MDDFDPEGPIIEDPESGRPPVYRDNVDGAKTGSGAGAVQMTNIRSTPTGGARKVAGEALLDLLDDSEGNSYSDLPAETKQEDLHV